LLVDRQIVSDIIYFKTYFFVELTEEKTKIDHRNGDEMLLKEMKFIVSTLIILAPILAFSQKPETKRIIELEKLLDTVSGIEKVDMLIDLAEQYYQISPQKCIEYAENALSLSKKINHKKGEAKASKCIAIGYYYNSRYDDAEKYFQISLKINETLGDKKEIANSLKNFGELSKASGNYEKALAYYSRSQQIMEQLSDKHGNAKSLYMIGFIYCRLSNYEKALEFHLKSLKIREQLGDHAGIAASFDGIGSVYFYIRNFETALEYFFKSLKIEEQTGSKPGIAQCLNNIGNVYRRLRNQEKALGYYLRSLDLMYEIDNKIGIALTLNNIGLIHKELKNYEKALDFYNEAQKIFGISGYKRGLGVSLNNIGSLYEQLFKYDKALEYYFESLKIKDEIGDKSGYVTSLQGVGSVYYSQKKHEESIDFFTRSLKLAMEINQPDGKWDAYYGLGLNFRKQKKYDLALAHYKKSIQIIEETRDRLKLEENKAGFMGGRSEVYEELISLLIELHRMDPQQGHDRESFKICEKVKARAFLDQLKESQLDTLLINHELIFKQKKINDEYNSIFTKWKNPDLSKEDRIGLGKELEKLDVEANNLRLKIKTTNPQYDKLVYPEPYGVEQVRENLLDKQTAIIEYFVGSEELFIFLVKKDDFKVHRLPISDGYEESLHNYAGTFSDRDNQSIGIDLPKKFYGELIGPIKDKLKNIKNLIIIPHGSLCYLPFEALITEKRDGNIPYLIEDFNIAYAPSASSLGDLIEQKPSHESRKDLLAIGDPVYKKETLTDKIYNLFRECCPDFWEDDLSNLYYSGQEIEGISKFFKKNDQSVYVKDQATEDVFKTLPLRNYKILHLATHGLLDINNPMRSSLVFNLDQDPREDGFLQVREIYQLKLDADLAILSACHTGRGKLEKGEGVLGLTRAFFYAGARSVLSSLWKIDDKASAVFMEYFYKFLKLGRNKAEALRLAKLKMIKTKYRDPFYWAPFIISGDSYSKVNFR